MLYTLLLMNILISYSGISENQSEKLSLTMKYFPDTELIWSKSFEGKMRRFDIAKSSGHVVISLVNYDRGEVYLFDKNGKLLWKINNLYYSEIRECIGVDVSISDNGEIIGVFWWGDFEWEEVQVYDINGDRLYANDHGITGVGVEVSPEGRYIKHLNVRDHNGNKIVLKETLKGLPIEKLKEELSKRVKDIRTNYVEFVSENELAVMFGKVLHLFSFPDGKLKWKSEELNLGSSGGKIRLLDDYILVSGEKTLYCFSKEGKLKWKKGLRVERVSLSSNKRKLAIFTGRNILVLDIETGEKKLESSRIKSQIGSKSLLFIGNKIFVSGYTGGFIKDVHKGYWTFILQFENEWNIIDESYERGLVLGTSTSPVIIVYESDATGDSDNTGIIQYENATCFNIDVLKKLNKGIILKIGIVPKLHGIE